MEQMGLFGYKRSAFSCPALPYWGSNAHVRQGHFDQDMLFFSGGLYLIALTANHEWGVVTMFGGLGLVAGWAMLAIRLLRERGVRLLTGD